MYRRFLSKLLFRLPPEVAHRVALSTLRAGLAVPGLSGVLSKPALPGERDAPVRVWNMTFRCPIGLAAGFDKNARYIDIMETLGFGFVEVGSITARPWAGNPSPRLFRLPDDGALINRMGLNNEGADVVAARLDRVRRRVNIPILVNIAKTPVPGLDLDAGVDEYIRALEVLTPVADAIVLNVSCPNTGDGRTFEDPAALDVLLARVRERLSPDVCPLAVKVSGDLDAATLSDAIGVALRHQVDGIVAINTSVSRSGLTHASAEELDAIGRGGLSGAPLFNRAIATVSKIRSLVGPDLPIIGVGGVATAAEVRAMRLAGATLVEIYTGFVYGGPHIVSSLVPGWQRDRSRVPATSRRVISPPDRVA